MNPSLRTRVIKALDVQKMEPGITEVYQTLLLLENPLTPLLIKWRDSKQWQAFVFKGQYVTYVVEPVEANFNLGRAYTRTKTHLDAVRVKKVARHFEKLNLVCDSHDSVVYKDFRISVIYNDVNTSCA